MKSLLFFCFFIFCLSTVYCQPVRSLQSEVKAVAELVQKKDIKAASTLLTSLEKHRLTELRLMPEYYFIKGRILFEQEDYQPSVAQYLLAKSLYRSKSDLKKVALTNTRLAINYTLLNEFSVAEKHAQEALNFYQSNPLDVDYVEARSDLGTIYLNTGEYLKAAQLFMANLKFYDKSGTVLQKGKAYAQIGLAYDYAGMASKAEGYYLQAIEFRTRARDTLGLMNTFNNLGVVNKNQKNYPKAIGYYQSSYKLASESNKEAYKINPLINLGVASRHLGKHDKAINYYSEALNIAKKLKRESQVATISNNLAVLYNSIGEYDKAYPLIKQAVDFSEAKGTLEDKVEYNQHYSATLKGLRKFEEAYEVLIKSYAFSDSLYRTENSKIMADLSVKYEIEKKEQQIKLLSAKTQLQQANLSNQELEIEKQQLALAVKDLDLSNKGLLIKQKENAINQKSLETSRQKQQIITLNQQGTIQQLQIKQRNISLVITLVFIVFILSTSYLIHNRRKLKAQADLQNAINIEQEAATKAILDAEEKERRRIASDLHDGVGQLLSAALMNYNSMLSGLSFKTEIESDKAKNTLALLNESYDEMRSISHQMMPNALIKAGLISALREFVSRIDQDQIRIELETAGLNERIDEQTETIIYRVIQESVSNVIKHAAAKKLSIQLVKDSEGLFVTLEDDGRGFDAKNIKKSQGIGMRNIISRIEFLKGTVDVDSRPGKGTLIAIFVPLRELS